jgi:hypothetical protein
MSWEKIIKAKELSREYLIATAEEFASEEMARGAPPKKDEWKNSIKKPKDKVEAKT